MRLEAQEFSKGSKLKNGVFKWKIDVPFRKKICAFYKLLEVAKFAGECDWINKNSQNVQNLSFLQKIDGIFEKKFDSFLKISKGSKFARECDWIGKNSQNVQNLSFFKR